MKNGLGHSGRSLGESAPVGQPQVDPGRPPRKIIHVDMDAFYASVEQRDAPELKGKPVAVGGGHRGVVAAASYEARVFGVRSAMPSVTAKRRCPDLIFVKPRFDVYREVSQQIRAIFADYTPLIEPLSLDEAYLDVSEDRLGLGSARAIAQDIRRRIREETGLTASAGVSYCKFIAKLASDHRKPDGLCVITPDRGADFVASLPVARFHGIGPVTAKKMEALGIHTGADLRAWSLPELEARFGSSGGWYWRICRGIDEREVKPDRPYKSVSAERTFDEDLIEPGALAAELERIAGYAWARVERAEVTGRTVTLKVKFGDFTTITRSKSFVQCVDDQQAFAAAGQALLAGLHPLPKGIRLLGLGLHSLCEEGATGPLQLTLAV
ncbi:DNA polymerase IV [Sphingomonas sinipercae]|uniref:DNA polymerase IV n=1 Tax=Sphingomonas sinipercae TaxID=2714944 RepID=A0A6G7ZL84_9SPHN|nr:DNA polymerase IV [Sphingomonas sinipercae]QIL01685.1 DNA polymerase IV [Sphingomonas sinipercae]